MRQCQHCGQWILRYSATPCGLDVCPQTCIAQHDCATCRAALAEARQVIQEHPRKARFIYTAEDAPGLVWEDPPRAFACGATEDVHSFPTPEAADRWVALEATRSRLDAEQALAALNSGGSLVEDA